ncbi:uncharacterized protein Z518_01460 [Rhinocladiella mackenziei CBS 650.93]|uniref:Rhinocladiella mackenziei CBS 650.93 unplaced genomic scaffold supercont1.1, whole genome shotgun sequence n=1 Tax=Rhinocladiella mackenziei CBS 650.93 TaxID=1442369 RepID=A0A0D2HI65_9EURO|nr:uncharacterized protein Z518_01460 [Rhinocladiella mackenziei CBS 650.93]KIX10378.1 hypothetical protein Z518_01460 [Rhinocladiella mackenziei CBS 650.93]
MTSILRLGSKDRSSLLFKRQSPDNVSDSPSDALALRLPDISHLDTRSFTGLFDQFVNYENPDQSPEAQDRDLVARTPNPTSADNLASSSEVAKVSVNNVDQAKFNINRNDSTSTCYSQATQRESDYSPLVTRHSSSSSYTQEPSSALSRTASTKNKPLTVTTRPSKRLSTHISGSRPTAQISVSRTNSSSIMVVSLPPNLDKPLPPGPSDGNMASSSVPDLLLRQQTAELAGEPLSSSDPSSSILPIQRASTFPERMVSTKRASGGEAVSELPAWSPRDIRAARLGKAVAHSHHRNRSVSETAAPQQQAALGIERSRRHTADFQRLSSNGASSARPTKPRQRRTYAPITAATAERVIYKIMCNLHSVQDLQSTAMVSKGFLRTFQRNESKLVSHLIFKTSRPAWELRRSILALKGSNEFVLKDFRRDSRTLTALKSFIVAHCSSNCKQSTLIGLLGQDDARKAQIDDALWRIWTYCALFGNTVAQSGPSQTEIDWLNGSKAANNKQLGAGFAIGNGKGLTTQELEDMNEMWHCLQGLISGFQGREQEAKQAGVFDNWHLRETSSETQHLAEWTSYLLTLGPQVVLSLSSSSFDQARVLGLTKWPAPPAGHSRSTFLISAIAQVYQERVLEEATLKAAQFSMPRGPVHRPTRSFDERQLASILPPRTIPNQTQSLRIDTSSPQRRPVSTNALADGKLEIRPDCDPASDLSRSSNMFPASPTADPTAFYALGMTPTASVKLGATLFPMDYASPAPRVPFRAPERPAAASSGAQVVDPVDKAMALLVHELGFGEMRARKALAMCDTGSGIDLHKAIELLAVDSKDSKHDVASPVELPTPQEISSVSKLKKQPKAYCDGHCKRTLTTMHSRNKSTGTSTDVSISPVSAIDEAEWQDTISPLVASPVPTPRPVASLGRGPSKSAKAWKVLGIGNPPKRKNSVLRIDEYQAKVERRKSMRATNGGTSPGVKDGLSKNILGLGIGSTAGAKSAEEQLERAREQERRKKEKNPSSRNMPRYA